MFDALVQKAPKRTMPEKKLSRADSNAALRKEIGDRFVEARRINGWDQSEASKLLGYANSTQLSLIEQGRRLPPHEILITASSVYGVSVDFLMGLSNEPERDPKAAERDALVRHVNEMLAANARRQVTLLMQYLAHGTPSIKTATALLDQAEAMVAELAKVRSLNPKVFDERLKGAARLLTISDQVKAACVGAREMLSRHERVMDFKMRAEEGAKGLSHPLLDGILPVGRGLGA